MQEEDTSSGRKRVCNYDNQSRDDAEVVALLPKTKKRRTDNDTHKISNEMFNETSYYFKNGLRCVVPYYFTFVTHAKGRWVERKVYDVFCEEFKSETPEYYEKAIKSGKVTVNGKAATMATVIQNNDVVTHKVHRHEPPVTAQPLKIIHCDDQLVVIDKPSSIAVHPCGRYRHNSVMFILGKEYGLKNLFTIHRLDRLTSGLLIFSKSLSKAQQMEKQIRERKVQKVYIAKVKGQFPKSTVECNEPILVISHTMGVCCVDPSGKPCSTSFTCISSNSKTSLIKCHPKTGRMHQIRVHLQWLGFPILNDPLYNHPAWGEERGAKGQGIRDINTVLSDITKTQYGEPDVGITDKRNAPKQTDTSTLDEGDIPNKIRKEKEINNEEEEYDRVGDDSKEEVSKEEDPPVLDQTNEQYTEAPFGQDDTLSTVPIDPDCTECHSHHSDPTPNDLVMYLHALKYQGEDWEFSTEVPEWAQED